MSLQERKLQTWSQGRDWYPRAFELLKDTPPPDELWRWHSASLAVLDAYARESLLHEGFIPDRVYGEESAVYRALEGYWKAVDGLDRRVLSRLVDAGCRFD